MMTIMAWPMNAMAARREGPDRPMLTILTLLLSYARVCANVYVSLCACVCV